MTAHPLDPLSATEISDVQRILVREKDVVRPHWRIASIELREPAKEVVRGFRPGDEIVREANVTAWNTGDGTAYVGIVSLTRDALASWEARPGKHPNATVDEWHECDEAMRRHPRCDRRSGGAWHRRPRPRAGRRVDLRRAPHRPRVRAPPDRLV